MKKPLISIIVTYYNKKKYIKKTINSLINQTYKNYQLIFVFDNQDKEDLFFIKKILKKIFKNKSIPPVIYGGSVDGTNIHKFRDLKVIDGFLIGGASKSSKKFIDIIKNYYR